MTIDQQLAAIEREERAQRTNQSPLNTDELDYELYLVSIEGTGSYIMQFDEWAENHQQGAH